MIEGCIYLRSCGPNTKGQVSYDSDIDVSTILRFWWITDYLWNGLEVRWKWWKLIKVNQQSMDGGRYGYHVVVISMHCVWEWEVHQIFWSGFFLYVSLEWYAKIYYVMFIPLLHIGKRNHLLWLEFFNREGQWMK